MAKILFPVIACALLMPIGVLTSVLHDGGLRETYWGDLGDIRHLVLNTSIPDGRPRMVAYALGVPPVTRERCDDLVGKWYPGSVFECDAADRSSFAYRYRSTGDYTESIEFGYSGDIRYINDSALERWFTVEHEALTALSTGDNASLNGLGLVSQDEALKIGTEELAIHPGFPGGYFLDTTRISVIQGLNYSLVSGYTFVFSRTYKGYRVTGDRAQVSIAPNGDVLNFQSLWRQVKGPLYTATVVSATEATLYLDTHLPVYFSLGQPEVRVDRVELGYHFGVWDDVWTEMRPVWIFNVTVGGDSKDHFYVDALDLAMR